VAASLAADLYRLRAIPPAYTWLDGAAPPTPTITVANGLLAMTPGDDEPPRWWVVRSQGTAGWTTRVVFGAERSIGLPAGTSRVLMNAIDVAGNASGAAEWRAP
jgi:hypothetical protein